MGGVNPESTDSQVLISRVSVSFYLPCLVSSLEYDPLFYGLYLHDEVELPKKAKLWDYLDGRFSYGYQDTMVLHLKPRPVLIQLEGNDERFVASL